MYYDANTIVWFRRPERNRMKSDESRLQSAALLWTIAICVVLESIAVALFRVFAGSWGGAVVLSAIVLGPLSLWIAKPIYRYWLRAGR